MINLLKTKSYKKPILFLLALKKKITFSFFQATEKLPLFYQLIKDNRMAASFNGTVSTLASQQLRITLRQLGSDFKLGTLPESQLT